MKKQNTSSPDLSNPPPACPICSGEREWTPTSSGKWAAACFFCGKAEIFGGVGTPKVSVAAFGNKEDRSYGFVVTANLGGNHCVRIHVLKTRTAPPEQPSSKVTVSWPAIGATTAENARTIADALVKAAGIAERLEKAGKT